MTEEEIRRVAKEGAKEALHELGLADESAPDDIKEIRNWLQSFRLIKRTFTQTTARIFTGAFWALLIAGIFVYFSGHFHK